MVLTTDFDETLFGIILYTPLQGGSECDIRHIAPLRQHRVGDEVLS